MGLISEGKVVDYSSKTVALVVSQLRRAIAKSGKSSFRILECGAGRGNVTTRLLEVMRPSDRIVCVEVSPALSDRAQLLVGGDPRVTLMNVDLLELGPEERFDFVLIMIPANPFSVPIHRIWDRVMDACEPGTPIITLPYRANPSGLIARLSGNRRAIATWRGYRQMMKHHLEERIPVLWNFPPCSVVVLKK